MSSNDSRPSPLERLTTAMSTSDLTMEHHRRRDVDYILASGMAQARTQSATGGLHMISTRRGLRRAFDSVLALVVRLNVKRSWRLTEDELKVVTKQAVMHHVAPACLSCQGRGWEVAEGAPALSGRICKPCRGSGKRPVQRKMHDEITQVIGVLESIDQVTEDAIVRLLR